MEHKNICGIIDCFIFFSLPVIININHFSSCVDISMIVSFDHRFNICRKIEIKKTIDSLALSPDDTLFFYISFIKRRDLLVFTKMRFIMSFFFSFLYFKIITLDISRIIFRCLSLLEH